MVMCHLTDAVLATQCPNWKIRIVLRYNLNGASFGKPRLTFLQIPKEPKSTFSPCSASWKTHDTDSTRTDKIRSIKGSRF
jgi:hypothetical protein